MTVVILNDFVFGNGILRERKDFPPKGIYVPFNFAPGISRMYG